jgi:hypothetical protein
MRLLRWLVFALGLAVVAFLCTAIAARFSDGPIAVFPGGKLRGQRVEQPIRDWSLLEGRRTIELEVSAPGPRSVTTAFILSEGTLYVPSILAAWKTWPLAASQNGNVIVRVGRELYPLRAVRVTEPGEIRGLVRDIDRMLSGGSDDPADLTTWYFRLEPRR